jgi:hypothetical protein
LKYVKDSTPDDSICDWSKYDWTNARFASPFVQWHASFAIECEIAVLELASNPFETA